MSNTKGITECSTHRSFHTLTIKLRGTKKLGKCTLFASCFVREMPTSCRFVVQIVNLWLAKKDNSVRIISITIFLYAVYNLVCHTTKLLHYWICFFQGESFLLIYEYCLRCFTTFCDFITKACNQIVIDAWH